MAEFDKKYEEAKSAIEKERENENELNDHEDSIKN
jgi:hypothetical protein